MKVKSFSDRDRRNAEDYYRQTLREVSLAPSVTIIRDGMFDGFEALEKIVLPENLQIIGENAFRGCVNLKIVTIPDSVISIGRMAFLNCKSLKEVNITSNSNLKEIQAKAFENCPILTHVNLPKGLMAISEDTFKNCSSLLSIYIPDNVTHIGNFAFLNCKSLENIYLNSVSRLEWIGVAAFEGTSIRSFLSPSHVKTIKGGAFRETPLENLSLNPGLQELGSFAFSHALIRNVEIPGSLEDLVERTFDSCPNLVEVTLNEGVKVIEEEAFYNCRNLRKVSKPESLLKAGGRDMKAPYLQDKQTVPTDYITSEKRRLR